MNDLIRSTQLVTELEIEIGETYNDDIIKGIKRAIEIVEQRPTVEPVRGEWKFGKNHGDFVEAECSACKGLLLVKWYDEIDRYRFCPNCGADMRGEKND